MTDISATIDQRSTDGGAAGARRLAVLASALAILAIGMALVILRLGSLGDIRFRLDLSLVTFAALGTVVLFPVVGALIIQRRPATRVAWLMIAMGLSLGTGFVLYGYGAVGVSPRAAFPGALEAMVVSQLFFVPTLATGSTLLFLLFPTDRLLSRSWRVVMVLSAVGSAAYLAGTIIRPGELDPEIFPELLNPVGLPASWGGVTEGLIIAGNIALIFGAAAGALSLVIRYGRGDTIERAQIRWIALVGSLAAAAYAVAALQLPVISSTAWGLGFAFLACMPIAIGVAITRYRLYDIDRLINRALVYGALTAILAGVFTAAIGLAQRVFVAMTGESSDAAIVLTTLVVATLYAPLRTRLEAVVDRRFKYDHLQFGAYRDEVERVMRVLDPTRAGQRLVDEAVRELQATGGAVIDDADQPIATAGSWPVSAVIRMPVSSHGPLVALLVGPRLDGRPHDPRVVARLDETAALIATALEITRPQTPEKPG